MRRPAIVVLLVAVLTAATCSGIAASASTIDRNKGFDISWPECPTTMGIPGHMGQAKPMPPSTAGFLVIGLTNGPGWHVNPCIATQLAFARRYSIPVAAYAMTTYPLASQLEAYGRSGPYSASTLLGRLSNAGVAEARFNVATMDRQGFRSPVVWIDIETYTPNWSGSRAQNAAVVRGVVYAYKAAGYRVGFYSTRYMWDRILGDYGPRGYPEWRTVGQSSASAALDRCSTLSFAGGRAVLAQWWTTLKDHDLVCPAYRTQRSRWFTLT